VVDQILRPSYHLFSSIDTIRSIVCSRKPKLTHTTIPQEIKTNNFNILKLTWKSHRGRYLYWIPFDCFVCKIIWFSLFLTAVVPISFPINTYFKSLKWVGIVFLHLLWFITPAIILTNNLLLCETFLPSHFISSWMFLMFGLIFPIERFWETNIGEVDVLRFGNERYVCQ